MTNLKRKNKGKKHRHLTGSTCKEAGLCLIDKTTEKKKATKFPHMQAFISPNR